MGAILDMLRRKMAERGIPLRCLAPGKVEPAAKGTVRQELEIQQGISKENGKKIVAAIKATKLKVSAQIQTTKCVFPVRKKRPASSYPNAEGSDFGVDLQFINMR